LSQTLYRLPFNPRDFLAFYFINPIAGMKGVCGMNTGKRIAEGEVGDRFEGGSRIVTGSELDLFCTIAAG
jgi:hypothetical protein